MTADGVVFDPNSPDGQPVRWFNDPRAVCAYILRGEPCSTGQGCGARGEPSCLTDAPGGIGTGSHGWPYRRRKVGGFVYPHPAPPESAS